MRFNLKTIAIFLVAAFILFLSSIILFGAVLTDLFSGAITFFLVFFLIITALIFLVIIQTIPDLVGKGSW